MKFSAREDIEAPIDYVFRTLLDFDGFERAAMRRGAEVQRIPGNTPNGVGTGWEVDFEFRGKPRTLKGQLIEMTEPSSMAFKGSLSGLDVELNVELVELSKRRTRLSVDTILTPNSLPARLLLQSLKLASQSLRKRYVKRVAKFAEDMEDRYKKSGSV